MYIDKKGNRLYKGNLHTHTTVSDGVKTPEGTKAVYKAMDYDFLTFTDHWIYGEGCEKDESGLIILSGIEYHFGTDAADGIFHIVGFGTEKDRGVTLDEGVQVTVDKINSHGGGAILAHPAWSMNTHDMLMKYEGFTATEIYNSVSDLPFNCRPYSGIVIDQLAARGYILPLVADDDTHFHKGEAGKAYILVNLGKAEATADKLVSAIKEGRYIATQGPIFEFYRDGDEVVVECETGAEMVTFFTNLPWENDRSMVADGEPLHEARFKIKPNHNFVRAEIRDKDGKIGFSQIIKL